ncbi:MAG: hypothetical protein RL710_1282, partial [Pseudomonadota bacterium]
MQATARPLQALGQVLRRSALVMAVGWVCVGCQSLPQPVKVDFAEPKQVQPPAGSVMAERAATGSLFSKVSYRPAFE